jgi:hypothetical protein
MLAGDGDNELLLAHDEVLRVDGRPQMFSRTFRYAGKLRPDDVETARTDTCGS